MILATINIGALECGGVAADVQRSRSFTAGGGRSRLRLGQPGGKRQCGVRRSEGRGKAGQNGEWRIELQDLKDNAALTLLSGMLPALHATLHASSQRF